MDKKKAILKTLNTAIQERGLTTYALAKITNINRSTLTKALQGSRNFNIRQFRNLIDILPFSIQKREELYKDFVEYIWGKEKFSINQTLLDIFDVLSNLTLQNADKFGGG